MKNLVYQLPIKFLVAYHPCLPLFYYKRLNNVINSVDSRQRLVAKKYISSIKAQNPHIENWWKDLNQSPKLNQEKYLLKEIYDHPSSLDEISPLNQWRLHDGKLNLFKPATKSSSSDFEQLGIRPRGCFYYPPGGFKEWHTNSEQPGWRGYLVGIDKPGMSEFIYENHNTNELVIVNDAHMNVNLFCVPKEPSPQVWHAVRSYCNRFSLGFLLKDTARIELILHRLDKFDDDSEIQFLITKLTTLGASSLAWGKKSFLEHLINVCKMLYVANRPRSEYLAGLFHSIYSTHEFAHDLQISKESVEDLIGSRAEMLVSTFCTLRNRDLNIIAGTVPDHSLLSSLRWILLCNRLDANLDDPRLDLLNHVFERKMK
ncbi:MULTISPECIES: DUF6817 domain-containing protein [Prochlorococcus]|uniref:DUF6817 domain-containing protein n=1 Tax=Prochlorococcus TaxID=1218 RepID=UPI0007B3E4CD|nr:MULTISPECIES: hypothetical protein [Prochlorococcus]KZR84576.1 hypothetical protein PMIT1327_00049 [Prochlorococcus marinus str. MIT 1327]NMP05789.1 hypothetical protein [Prochlorococcus sp. P1361]